MARNKYTEVEKKIMRGISANLKRLLDSKGISQKVLSELSEVSTSTLSDYVNGHTLISPGNLEKIAKALRVEKSDIYPIDSYEKNSSANAEELTKSFDLADEELMPKFAPTLDGEHLTEEEYREMLLYIRARRQMKISHP